MRLGQYHETFWALVVELDRTFGRLEGVEVCVQLVYSCNSISSLRYLPLREYLIDLLFGPLKLVSFASVILIVQTHPFFELEAIRTPGWLGADLFLLRVASCFGVRPLVTSDLNHGVAIFLIVLEEALFASLSLLLKDLLGLHMRQLFEVDCTSDIIVSLGIVVLWSIRVGNLEGPLVVPQECQLVLYIRKLLIRIVLTIEIVPRLHLVGSGRDLKWLLTPLSGSLEALVEAFVDLLYCLRFDLPAFPLSLKAVREEVW